MEVCNHVLAVGGIFGTFQRVMDFVFIPRMAGWTSVMVNKIILFPIGA